MISCLKSRPLLLIILFIISLFASCAEVAGPPGGPRDLTAPTIISTIPSSESVNVLIDNKLIMSFSERIDRKSIEEAIFISPRPEGELKYSWKKNSFTITLPDSFKANTTYVVTVGTTVKDIRGNKLEESYSFAFSTGETIANGNVNGFVFREDKPASGITIGLYDYSIIDSISLLDSLYPPYITQSGKNGEYEFNYLPDGEYLILAYKDENKNQLLNYPAEMFGLTDRSVIIEKSNKLPALYLNMTFKDTTSLSIISTTYSSDNMVKVRLSGAIMAELVYENLNQIGLVTSNNQQDFIAATSVKESSGGEMSVYNFYFADLSETAYKLRIERKLLEALGIDTSFIEGSEFAVQLKPDSTGPKIEFFSHDKKTIFPDENNFEISFSEPMKKEMGKDSLVIIYDGSDTRQDISYRWIDHFRLGFELENPEWSKEYFVVLGEKRFSDLAGNRLGDSTSVYKYYTYNSDSLGEASGIVENSLLNDSAAVKYLTFSDVSGKPRFTKKFTDNQFYFRLPPGQYLMSGFIDDNNNGFFDSGSLDPFELSETMAMGSDTIRVRARFETTGLNFEFK